MATWLKKIGQIGLVVLIAGGMGFVVPRLIIDLAEKGAPTDKDRIESVGFRCDEIAESFDMAIPDFPTRRFVTCLNEGSEKTFMITHPTRLKGFGVAPAAGSQFIPKGKIY